MAAFFTLVFPTTFLVVISAIAGNALVDDRSGIRLAQFLTPVFAVFGVCMASFVSLALGVAYCARGRRPEAAAGHSAAGVDPLRGALATAVFISLVAVVLVVGIGVAFYGVDIVWRTVPGRAPHAGRRRLLLRRAGAGGRVDHPDTRATQALANGGLILLAFISDIFIVHLPDWLDRLDGFSRSSTS